MMVEALADEAVVVADAEVSIVMVVETVVVEASAAETEAVVAGVVEASVGAVVPLPSRAKEPHSKGC